MNPTAIATNRFGLGAVPGEPLPADARDGLLRQLDRFEALPGRWGEQERTPTLVARMVREQQAARQLEPVARAAAQESQRREARERLLACMAARMQSALATPAPFVERLVHFWANHFAVSTDKVAVVGLAGAFEADAIRPHVLGRFEDLLAAATRHPAMLLFLDQPQSIGPLSVAALGAARRDPASRRGLNENLAREVLELHTLGVRHGYTQDDVTEFARALTGWGLDGAEGGSGFRFRPELHEPGTRVVLGRRYAAQGEAQSLDILRDLARAPATARHIAFKLARHFVADVPPPAVVDRLAAAFLRSEGDLHAVYAALVDSPEAWEPGPVKFKTPWDWSVSALRALGRRELTGPQVAGLLAQLGQPVWRPGSPAGWDDVASAWAAPDALVRRVETAQRLTAQAPPGVDARGLAPQVLPGGPGEATRQAIARAETGADALALLLVSPEFMRR
ncbi:DUF1800 domain-containing protein [Ramlibacter sp. MAHUQ-53]|uniref:DUF1800 domain-containing protein n=1 Tax=unclassified Ramlibacter TaxID=2617605 RepID=UPI0036350997